MAKKMVSDIPVKGKIVLMRVDFNVPIDNGTISDDRRIVQAMPTIKNIVERGGRLILMSHLGRPKGGPEAKYSLKPVVAKLSSLLGKPAKFCEDCIGPAAEKMAAELKDGEV
ncbi:MAG TPA: phosphoglycerate kinase, partial [Tepidisphaeraceae bacterium]|nr:phosphoglycerate kinase [Tepidisphaeraceae bacterium]